MLKGQFIANSKQDSQNIAIKIAKTIKPQDILAFSGDLGAGKSFFCREIIKELCGPNTKVSSPTFNLLQIYTAQDFDIYHFDLYRLKHKDEIYELGIEEAFSSHITLIEWPEIIISLLPSDTIFINIEIIADEKRCISIKS